MEQEREELMQMADKLTEDELWEAIQYMLLLVKKQESYSENVK